MFKHLLHYIPALFILIFGMLALEASVSLNAQNDIFESQYQMLLLQAAPDAYDENSPQFIKIKAQQERIDEHETWLYWSVIAIGLSGFLLFLLNADKVRSLAVINQEKLQTLKLLENRLAAMEATMDGIGIVDPHGNLTYMNKSLLHLHGIDDKKMDEHLGKPWVNLYTEKGRKEIEESVLPHVKEHGSWQGQSKIVRADGKIIHTEFSLTRLPDGGFIGTAHDVSGTVNANKEKEKVQDQLFQAQKMEAVGRLAGGIAHDFNNILAAMNGYAEFLIEDLEEGSAQKGFAVNILQAGNQARSLVDQMLAFSRTTSNEFEHIDLNTPLQETLSMLKASLPKSLEVVVDVADNDTIINGNATQIAQVLMNLCVNAKDAMEKQNGVLKISMQPYDMEKTPLGMISNTLPDPKDNPAILIEEQDERTTILYLGTLGQDSEYICLSVEDTGTGIPKQIMQKMFEPFFTTKPVDKGTGLGLSTVHGVVTAHRGAMIVTSVIGQGTRFDLYFPIASQQSHVTEAPQTQSLENITAHILLVEDQADVRNMTVKALTRLGHTVDTAENGLYALDALRENPGSFDLVITDYNMPKMTGLELVYQAHMDFPDLPFVLLSGYSEEKLTELMGEHEAIKAIIRKPVKKDDLGKILVEVLSNMHQQQAA